MIFPRDVNKRVQDRNKLAGENKVQLYIVLFVLGNIFGFLGLSFLFAMTLPGAPLGFTVTIQVLILLVISIFIFRFVIFDERSKIKEYQGQQTDSFARYMYLRKDSLDETEIAGNNVNIYEYVDGSALCVLEFRFGSNDDIKAAGTQELYEQILKCIASYGFESRVIVQPENFRTSVEFKKHIESVNRIDDMTMRKTIMMVTDNIMQQSYQLSNVDMVYLMIRSLSNYQKADLEIMLKSLIGIFENSVNAFRSVVFLNRDQLLEFYREFYGIEAIDLAMMRTIDLAQDLSEDFAKVVKLYSLRSDDGRSFRVVGDAELFKVNEREINV